MYFLTYLHKDEKNYGMLNKNKDKIIPLSEIFKSKTLNDFICTFNESILEEINNLMDSSNLNSIPLSEVKLLAPIPHPKRNIFCLGKNYLDHAKEVVGLPGADDNIPKFPIYFSKIANPAIGHLDIIKNHSEITKMIDYEVELGVIIGKDGINIKEDEAEEYVFGYTIVNDVSARNLQRKHTQWFKGKSLETFCPMGPYIVHKSQIPFPVELDIKCSVNGELRQNSNTKNMIFNIANVISDLSKGMELKAGDIIITGTPSGVGLGFSPFKFLNSKDKVECYIEKIGTLTNFIE
ncbi:fumarylacetoacetate hydrolase family protein [Anaeromicrobium sediminis]|uniref:Hydrolase n=1 Tax=Anaeromicrobium sediminis TaxID=1478221 RepID=A0A267MHX0_9FIRM|nr:fumarylacetoacetate hydrolase family protein [Anaeromicrobium sediminis]PAB59169.1 hydrolase [Anaeromicrobium sediminis]